VAFDVAIGNFAMQEHRRNNFNVAVGHEVLSNDTTGYDNTGIGFRSLLNNRDGFKNTAIGIRALSGTISGFENTAIGSYAMNSVILGDQNTALGSNAFATGAFSNSVALGFGTNITNNFQARVGNNLITSIGGQVAWTTLSDKRFKTNVQNNVPGLEFINKLKPVTYNLNRKEQDKFQLAELDKDTSANARAFANQIRNRNNADTVVHTGFLAQDVEQVAKSIGYNFDGVDAPGNDKDFYGLRYSQFVVPLVKAVQELDAKNKQLEAINQSNQTKYEELLKRIELLEKK
jgi:trimeric autotransporter adhesin